MSRALKETSQFKTDKKRIKGSGRYDWEKMRAVACRSGALAAKVFNCDGAIRGGGAAPTQGQVWGVAVRADGTGACHCGVSGCGNAGKGRNVQALKHQRNWVSRAYTAA